MTIHSKICKATSALNKASMRPEVKEERPTLSHDRRTHGRIKTGKKHFYALRVFKEINQVLLSVFRKPSTSTKRRTTGWPIFLRSAAKWERLTQASSPLYRAYREFSDRSGDYVRRSNDFKAALEQAGFRYRRTNAGSMFFGLKLKENVVLSEPF